MTRQPEPETTRRAAALHRQALVVDSLAGGPGVYTPAMLAQLDGLARLNSTAEIFREIERLHTCAFLGNCFADYWSALDQAGVDVLSISIGAWGDAPFSFRGAVQDLGEWHRRFQQVSRFLHVTRPEHLAAAHQGGRTGILLGFQDCTQLDQDLRNAETFHGLGVRMIQLTYNGAGPAGSGCISPTDDGLTPFGKDLIRCLNDLGIVIDLSHCGPRTTVEAIGRSRAPVAVSHAACAALCPHPRNKNDDILRALADHNGYFGVCAVPAFLAPPPHQPSLSHMIGHIHHALDHCGPEHVGIGTDWGVAHSPKAIRTRLQAEAAARGFGPQHRFDFAAQTTDFDQWATGFPRITLRLVQAGLDTHTIEGILGGNFVRLYHATHQAASASSDPQTR